MKVEQININGGERSASMTVSLEQGENWRDFVRLVEGLEAPASTTAEVDRVRATARAEGLEHLRAIDDLKAEIDRVREDRDKAALEVERLKAEIPKFSVGEHVTVRMPDQELVAGTIQHVWPEGGYNVDLGERGVLCFAKNIRPRYDAERVRALEAEVARVTAALERSYEERKAERDAAEAEKERAIKAALDGRDSAALEENRRLKVTDANMRAFIGSIAQVLGLSAFQAPELALGAARGLVEKVKHLEAAIVEYQENMTELAADRDRALHAATSRSHAATVRDEIEQKFAEKMARLEAADAAKPAAKERSNG